MWIESVTAHAFGPFTDRTLAFGPGLNVVYGPNEAGKSTWHAALYAGLCGMRRSAGRLSREDQDFAERHRPWDGGSWEVGALVALADGRRVELRHDLQARTGDVRDADLGRSYTAEVMHDGAPDGSKWLGLDRRSFLATACVRQAELLGVRDDPKLLREYLERAAATAGADATVAEALERLDRFFQERVGPERLNSNRPLQQARERVELAKAALATARDQHAAYLHLQEEVEELAGAAAAAERQRRLVEARVAAQTLARMKQRLARAVEIAEQYPAGRPAGPAPDDGLAQDIAAVLGAWENRQAVADLVGPSAVEIQHQIDALPPVPEGDTDEHPSVAAAATAFREARSALAAHEASRPPATPKPDTGGLSEQELRRLADDLATPVPALDPDLTAQADRASQRVDELARRQPRRGLLVGGGIVALVGVGLLVLGLVAPAVVLLIAAIGLVGFAWRGNDGERLQALEALRDLEARLGEQRYAVEQVKARQAAAKTNVIGRGLPADPDQLRRLADALSDAAAAERELARWSARFDELDRALTMARAGLATALRDRAAGGDGDVTDLYERYVATCRERAAVTVRARQRAALEEQLAIWRQAESAVASALRQRARAADDLRAVATRGGIGGADDADLVEGLRAWQRRHAVAVQRWQAAQRDWSELETLLDGRTLADLGDEVTRGEEALRRLATGLEAAEVTTVVVEDDSAAQLDRLRRAASDAVERLADLRGQVAERRRTLPSVAEAEEELQAAEAELARVRQLARTLDSTRQYLTQAQERVHRDVAPMLTTSVRRWLPHVTANRYHDVRVDPQTLDVQVVGSSRRWRRAALLSHGMAEQVYLLLRVAMAELLPKRSEGCPLVLDDVTVQFDGERKRAVLEMLQALSGDRQIIVFTQEAAVLAWAEASLQAPRDHLVRLDPSAIGS